MAKWQGVVRVCSPSAPTFSPSSQAFHVKTGQVVAIKRAKVSAADRDAPRPASFLFFFLRKPGGGRSGCVGVRKMGVIPMCGNGTPELLFSISLSLEGVVTRFLFFLMESTRRDWLRAKREIASSGWRNWLHRLEGDQGDAGD